METIKKEIANKRKKIDNSNTVNSNSKYINTVNSNSILDEIEDLLKSNGITPEGVGKRLAEKLDDKKSETYYFLLAKENNHTKLLEALHLTLEAESLGKIKTKKPIYFLGILKNWGLKTKFKK